MLQLVLFSKEENFQTLVFSEEKNIVKVDSMYRMLECDYVDVVRLSDKNNIDLWVDDEGLLKSGNYVHEISVGDTEVKLAGRVLFLSYDDEGNSIGLSDEQLKWLESSGLTAQLIGYTH